MTSTARSTRWRTHQSGETLVTPHGSSRRELPHDATVDTPNLRRRAQLLSERPDLQGEPLCENVDTRLEGLLAPVLQDNH
ncbi:hypothetical protein [Natrinema sp. H-ect4]|uniref:hypothetical protein n=1 Tax=Natrinema sp. H-ect4 TaxID=3242699 RepID=UPI0035A81DFE